MSREDFELPDPAAFTVSDDVLLPEFDSNGHVDEGTVHAWLDGAFAPADAERVEAHVATCATCQRAVAEARGLLAASARILGALDGVPMNVVPAADAAVTASRIADERPSVLSITTAPNRSRRSWTGFAAAAVLMVGAITVWQRSQARVAGVAAPVADSASFAERAPAPAAAEAPAKDGADSMARVAAVPSVPGVTPSAPPTVQPKVEVAEARPRRAETTSDSTVSAMADRALKVAAAPAAPQIVAPVQALSAPSPQTPAPQARALGATVSTTVASASESNVASAPGSFVVYGTVRNEHAQPIGFARVDITNANGTLFGFAQSAQDGRYRVPGNAPRKAALAVMVRSVGYTFVRTAVRVMSDSIPLDIRMNSAAISLSEVVVTNDKSKADRRVDRVAAPAAPAPAPATFAPPQAFGVAGGIARDRAIEPAKRSTTGMDSIRRNVPPVDREQYDRIEDNPFLAVRSAPLSTFSVDVDRAAYGNVRRFITAGNRPPKDAVRIEELINYFPYDLAEPRGNDPVNITTDVMPAPWQPKHQLVRIALQSKRIATDKLPPNNLVFLIDVSGSMQSPDKLPLVKQSLRLLVDQLRPQDRVALVVYAGSAGVVLPSTSGDEKVQIAEAIDRLEAGGSTAGGAGIMLAYRTAREHFLKEGNNRVILATDGDFNVGATGGNLERIIELEREGGVYLTVLGFGTGNYQDATMEKLAKKGNGNYAYIDELNEARKMLVREMGATLLTVANDVKLQIEFNPNAVQGYRLIGYEDRLLRDEDFNDDKKDAGDMGTGHQVTALYEVVPVGVNGTVNLRGVDASRYATPSGTSTGSRDEMLFVKLRYKKPGESNSRLLQQAVRTNSGRGTTDTRFAAAVAQFGMLLRDSEYKGTSSAAQVLEQARAALGEDEGGYRAAFVELVERWRRINAR